MKTKGQMKTKRKPKMKARLVARMSNEEEVDVYTNIRPFFTREEWRNLSESAKAKFKDMAEFYYMMQELNIEAPPPYFMEMSVLETEVTSPKKKPEGSESTGTSQAGPYVSAFDDDDDDEVDAESKEEDCQGNELEANFKFKWIAKLKEKFQRTKKKTPSSEEGKMQEDDATEAQGSPDSIGKHVSCNMIKKQMEEQQLDASLQKAPREINDEIPVDNTVTTQSDSTEMIAMTDIFLNPVQVKRAHNARKPKVRRSLHYSPVPERRQTRSKVEPVLVASTCKRRRNPSPTENPQVEEQVERPGTPKSRTHCCSTGNKQLNLKSESFKRNIQRKRLSSEFFTANSTINSAKRKRSSTVTSSETVLNMTPEGMTATLQLEEETENVSFVDINGRVSALKCNNTNTAIQEAEIAMHQTVTETSISVGNSSTIPCFHSTPSDHSSSQPVSADSGMSEDFSSPVSFGNVSSVGAFDDSLLSPIQIMQM